MCYCMLHKPIFCFIRPLLHDVARNPWGGHKSPSPLFLLKTFCFCLRSYFCVKMTPGNNPWGFDINGIQINWIKCYNHNRHNNYYNFGYVLIMSFLLLPFSPPSQLWIKQLTSDQSCKWNHIQDNGKMLKKKKTSNNKENSNGSWTTYCPWYAT